MAGVENDEGNGMPTIIEPGKRRTAALLAAGGTTLLGVAITMAALSGGGDATVRAVTSHPSAPPSPVATVAHAPDQFGDGKFGPLHVVWPKTTADSPAPLGEFIGGLSQVGSQQP
jgi:hypothetical protein